MGISYQTEEDLLLLELKQAMRAETKKTGNHPDCLPEDLTVEDLGTDDAAILEKEACQALHEEFMEKAKHITIKVNEDGSIEYQSGQRKNISVERFLTNEEKDDYSKQYYNLIHHMAHKYHNNHALLDEYEEFYGEATLGFAKALNTFDIASGIPFQNYACFCMDNVLRTFCGRLTKVSNPAIAISLDEVLNAADDSSSTFGDIYFDPTQTAIEDTVEQKLSQENLQNFFSSIGDFLNPLQTYVVSTYYGINDCERLNKTQIGKMLDLPMSKVNEVLAQAFTQLRQHLALYYNIQA